MGWKTCNDFIKDNYEEDRFDGGEHMGGCTETGLHGRWHYDKNGNHLRLTCNSKSKTMISAELWEKNDVGDLVLISERKWDKKGNEILK